jgi:hypothetical protein
VDLPDNTPDDFDKDITSEPTLEQGDFLVMAFAEMHETFLAMREVGFTENQALKFLSYVAKDDDGD